MKCLRPGKLLDKIPYMLPNTAHAPPTLTMVGPLASVLRNSGLRRGVSLPDSTGKPFLL